MAHIARSIDIDAPVDAIHAQWLLFEEQRDAESIVANVRWRSESVTFEPIPTGTRITLRVRFDPLGGDPGLAARLQRVLDGFAVFVAACAAQPA